MHIACRNLGNMLVEETSPIRAHVVSFHVWDRKTQMNFLTNPVYFFGVILVSNQIKSLNKMGYDHLFC